MHHDDSSRSSLTRRRFLQLSAGRAPAHPGAGRPARRLGAAGRSPPASRAATSRRIAAIVWCRTDRPARLRVRYATTDTLAGARERVSAPTSAAARFHRAARPDRPAAGSTDRLRGAVRGRRRRAERTGARAFRTPGADGRAPVRIVWGGDVCGQGWGLDEARGGMKTFASMRAAEPDLFIHSGDLIYADGPIRRDGAPRRRLDLAQPGRGRGRRGRADARPVPRPLPLQPARRATCGPSTPTCR